MKLINPSRMFAGVIALVLSVSASAEFTVTVTNYESKAVEIYPTEHDCINHPNYFEKTVPASSTIQVHAKWMDSVCHNVYITVCRRDTGKCRKLTPTEYSKFISFREGDICNTPGSRPCWE